MYRDAWLDPEHEVDYTYFPVDPYDGDPDFGRDDITDEQNEREDL